MKSPTTPEWSVPVNPREIVDERGDPTFRIVAVPERGIVPAKQIVITNSRNSLMLPPEISQKKAELIQKRKDVLAKRHADAMEKWRQSGSQGEPPASPLFHDAHLLRVLPEDVSIDRDVAGNETLTLAASPTTYFDYVATRDGELPQEHRAMPLACCGAMQIEDGAGKKYALVTMRTDKVEVYPHYLHVVGGMISRDDPSKPVTDWWLEEVREETGVQHDELDMQGCVGVALDTHHLHTELMFLAKIRPQLEELFEQHEGSNIIIPRRKTDKEVQFMAVPLDPGAIQALLTGESADGRPWVPTGLANMLLAGKLWFGQAEDWYTETMFSYRKKIATLLHS